MKKSNIRSVCTISLFAATISIMAQFSIPLPFGVPLSLQNFAVVLAAILLGKKNGTLAVLVYLFLGLVGLPVFSNFRSGLQTLASPTGGFLLGYPLMTYLMGIGVEHRHQKGLFPLFMFLGYFIDYLSGLLIFCLSTSTGIQIGIVTCVLPFLPAELVKSILAGILGLRLHKRLFSYL